MTSTSTLRLFALCCLVFALAACGDDSDGAATADTGTADTATADTGTTDAGVDSGATDVSDGDATTADAGTDSDTGGEDAAAEVGEDAAADADDLASLAAVHAQVIENTCGGLACHLNGQAAGGLNLDLDDNIGDDLAATSTSGLPYVTPGEPENSYLLLKLSTAFRDVGGVGSVMPLGQAPLAEADIALIEAWIAAGAPD